MTFYNLQSRHNGNDNDNDDDADDDDDDDDDDDHDNNNENNNCNNYCIDFLMFKILCFVILLSNLTWSSVIKVDYYNAVSHKDRELLDIEPSLDFPI